ncbi:LytR/AlgR family response regulator transcription factor [Flagellimonas flava]|uniref:Two component transcriptional regulator, LytTR family n=1 Tax=Flagellimonas flava TaxID=570519 RepID=A0A1M5NK00_9FLAO|nr:LytTR family DNA-binding domain-containing protein [Allomuricauda flava]SHG89851.1 two component transcriptional regulator, LytTR family [Allomuricauda flava]
METEGTIKAIIVDDEARHHETLGKMLGNFCPEIEILGNAQNVSEAVSLIMDKSPQIIFLDIEMPGGNGFTLFDHFEEPPFEVIFTTAHDLYAINAIKYAALDYLMKPINIRELQDAVARAAKVINKKGVTVSSEKINVLKSNLKLEDQRFTKIALPSSDGIDFIEAEAIIRAEAERSYSNFYLQSGKKILVSKPLKEYEALLEQCNFFRVHKSHMINLTHLEKYVKGKGGYVIMKDGSHVDVSVRKKDDLLNRLM